MEIKNLKKAAERILKAIKSKEKIILYGDSDLDGIGSVVILKETIQTLGGKITSVYFPDREIEGYGINNDALNFLKHLAPALLIAADLGIGNFEEVKTAKKLGFEVIIIDHHEILDKIPKASIVIDPKQKGDKYPFKNFANVGIVFKLSQILLENSSSENLRNGLLEITALATIADLMPEIEENKIFIEQGLKSLENTFRPGLKAFLKIDSIKDGISTRYIAQKIISALNAGERIDHSNEAYSLLICSSFEEAKELAQSLVEKSHKKQLIIRGITEKIEARILKKMSESIVFEGDGSWLLFLLGPVASRIQQEYKKPVFVFKKGEKESCGAVRVPKNVNSVELMKKCSDILMTFGGHPQASGFRLKNENLEEFKACLIKNFKK